MDDEKRRRAEYAEIDEIHEKMTRQFRRNSTALMLMVALVLISYGTWHTFQHALVPGLAGPGALKSSKLAGVDSKPQAVVTTNKLVPLEAHIMSKCPDARDCLRDMVLPVMVQANAKVNFTLSFIGTPTENDGVDCRHGPQECMGNIIELCAAKIYPDPKIYLGFTMCITRRYKDIPDRELVEGCALEHAIDIKKLNDCATKDDGAFGVEMLRASVRRTTEAGVVKSCTVRLNEQIYCIRDDGEWKDCPSGPGVNDLIVAIEKLYRQS